MTTNGTHKTITIVGAQKDLDRLLDKYEWFHSSEIEGQLIRVYVEYMNSEIDALIPDPYHGFHIKLGFAAYAECSNKYGPIYLDFGSKSNKFEN